MADGGVSALTGVLKELYAFKRHLPKAKKLTTILRELLVGFALVHWLSLGSSLCVDDCCQLISLDHGSRE
jgi:hypothetical protein